MNLINLGPLSITQADSAFSIGIDDSVALGGGQAAGVVSAQGKGSIVINEALIIKLGIQAIAAKWPVIGPFLAGAEAEIDAVIAGL